MDGLGACTCARACAGAAPCCAGGGLGLGLAAAGQHLRPSVFLTLPALQCTLPNLPNTPTAVHRGPGQHARPQLRDPGGGQAAGGVLEEAWERQWEGRECVPTDALRAPAQRALPTPLLTAPHATRTLFFHSTPGQAHRGAHHPRHCHHHRHGHRCARCSCGCCVLAVDSCVRLSRLGLWADRPHRPAADNPRLTPRYSTQLNSPLQAWCAWSCTRSCRYIGTAVQWYSPCLALHCIALSAARRRSCEGAR